MCYVYETSFKEGTPDTIFGNSLFLNLILFLALAKPDFGEKWKLWNVYTIGAMVIVGLFLCSLALYYISKIGRTKKRPKRYSSVSR